MRVKTRTSSGFTLIEVALVVIIAGVLFAALAGSYAVYLQTAHAKAVRTNMDTIDAAIKEFLAVNGRLPCPAPLFGATSAPDAPGGTFGVEAAANCSTAGAVAGTVEITNLDTGFKVRIGMLPVRTLNLPDQYSQDSWKNRYRYAVTEVLASPGGYNPNNASVEVVDSSLPIVLPDSSVLKNAAGGMAYAHYVLVSQGPDGIGAYSNSGNLTVTCPPAGATAPLDRENCNDDYIFRKTSTVSTITGAKHYDDFITFASSMTLLDNDCGSIGMIHAKGGVIPHKDGNSCLTDMRIYDNDNVGIGMAGAAVPGYPLTVQNSGGGVTHNSNIISRFQANGSGQNATIQFSDNVTYADFISMLNGDLLFTTSNPAAVSAMMIKGSGNIGFGTTAPTSPLEISRTGAANSTIRLTNLGTGFSSLEFDTAEGDYLGGNYAVINLSNAGLFEINNGAGNTAITGGNVGIGMTTPGYKLDVNGDINATILYHSSDSRLKTNITTLDDSLNKILQLRGVSFHWKKDGTPGIGLIAQEVEKIYPDLVGTNPVTGYKAVQYDSLVGPIIEAIKKLYADITGIHQDLKQMQEKMDAQNGIIAAQDKKINELETQMQDLRAQVLELKKDKSGEETNP